MVQRRQILQDSVIAAMSRTMEPERISNWEKGRACLNHNPDWWSIEATKAEHNDARMICLGCPVLARCEEDFKKYRSERNYVGMFAGKMWGCGTKGPMSVEQWHMGRTKGGKIKDDAPRKYPIGWSEERVCECGEKFKVTAKNHTKKFCSERCINRKAYKAAKEKEFALKRRTK